MFAKDETIAVLVVQIAAQIADQHFNEDELIREVQNALSTGQQLSSLMRVDSLLILSLMQDRLHLNSQLIPYWLQPSRWATKGTQVPSSILQPTSEHILFDILQDSSSSVHSLLSTGIQQQ